MPTPRPKPARRRKVPFADLLADALLVARAGLRQSVKNVVIVRALRDGHDFDADWYGDAVRTELEAMAVETDADAARLKRELDYAKGRYYEAVTARDYVDRDVPALRKRRKVMIALAAELRARADDEEFLTELIADARANALDEIAATASHVPGRGTVEPLRGVAKSRALQRLREELRDYDDFD
jgi:hypothetical protein